MRQRRPATMRMCSATRAACRLLLFAVLACWPLATAAAQAMTQEMTLASRGPRFLRAPSVGAAPVEIDARSSAVLRRTVSLNLEGATVGKVLEAIERQTGLRFMYSRDALKLDRPVGLRADSITVAGALMEVLLDSGMDVLLSSARQVALVERSPSAPAQQTGVIVGRVTDRESGVGVPAVTVLVEGTRYGGVTAGDGRYRIAGVSAGTYMVSARRIGYERGASTVVVSAEQEVTADFALAASASMLDQVVVTGTVVPTEAKAVPTPISVFTAKDLEQLNIRRVDQLFRGSIPGSISWDRGSNNYDNSMTVRGASSLSEATSISTLKTFVDGVEVTDNQFAQIDVSSIERIEVVRGPQASTIYGSSGTSGVMQIFTKRGAAQTDRPQLDAQLSAGGIESRYHDGPSMTQNYSASVQGGSAPFTYELGGSYNRVGDWVPAYGSRTSNFHGGARMTQGRLTLDLSGRYQRRTFDAEWNPILAATGYVPYSKPPHQLNAIGQQGYSARLTYQPTPAWQHTLTLGSDRLDFGYHDTRARLRTPGDTLLTLYESGSEKTSVLYNSSLTLPLSPSYSAVVTAGVDHYAFTYDLFQTSRALTYSGNISTARGDLPRLGRGDWTNTGYYAQSQLAIRDALFVTGGLRAERNDNFARDVGTAYSPRAGVSYVRQIAAATAKLRASYGRNIKPPGQGQAAGFRGGGIELLPNPELRPEEQRGFDGGVDLLFGRAFSVGATRYDQTVGDVITIVFLGPGPNGLQLQAQNLGEVRNDGWELEATVRPGRFAVAAQYSITNSTVRRLPPSYTGDLRVGDQILDIPRHSGGGTVTYTPTARTSMSLRATYVGRSTGVDDLRLIHVFDGGTEPYTGSRRDYWRRYPAFTKLSLTASQSVTKQLTAFVSVENLTDSHAVERSNIVALAGRTTELGVRWRY